MEPETEQNRTEHGVQTLRSISSAEVYSIVLTIHIFQERKFGEMAGSFDRFQRQFDTATT